MTARARRSFGGLLGPPAVLLLGGLFVAAALYRLDPVYAADAGVLRSWQLAPRPMTTVRPVIASITDGMSDAFLSFGFGRDVCARYGIQSLCEQDVALLSDRKLVKRERLERQARRLFARRSSDVTVLVWDEGSSRIAVSVARYANEQATRRALHASRAARAGKKRREAPVVRSAWPEGEHFVVGMLVTAPTRVAAAQQLKESRSDVHAYVSTSRFLWYELLTLGPVLLLLGLFYGIRALLTAALYIAFIPVFLAVIVVLLIAVLYLLIRRRWGSDPEAELNSRFLDGLERIPMPWYPRRPGTSPPVRAKTARVVNLDEHIDRLEDQNRSAILVLATLVGLGIAVLTRSLFPASLVWGSLLLVALYSPAKSWRGSRWMVRGRTLVRVFVVLAVVGVTIGATPLGLVSDVRFQIAAAVVAAAIVIDHWRGLVTETAVGYAKWYEDIDTRSSVFLAGVGLLTLGGAAIFLVSNAEGDPAAHAREKLVGLFGLLVASSTAVYARAARDSAARERARRRATPHVLYLRSFGDDRIRVPSRRLERRGLERFSWRRTELLEDVIARSLSSIGPVVAIARPGTGQRTLGAARDSIVVEDWLSAVKSHMSRAVLVAVVLGSSEGLVRELETLDELGFLDRVCVFVPPLDKDEFRKRLNVLARQQQFEGLVGGQSGSDEWRRHVIALANRRGDRVVLTATKRRASAYRAAGAYLSRPVAAPDGSESAVAAAPSASIQGG